MAYILNVTPSALCRWEKRVAVPDGGNRQLIDLLYLNVRKKPEKRLAPVREELSKLLRFASPAGCLNTLMHDLVQK
jgi:hypothetical protein